MENIKREEVVIQTMREAMREKNLQKQKQNHSKKQEI